MSDPAYEAAERASEQFETGGQISLQAIAAARLALAPIRVVLDQLADDTVPPIHPGKLFELYEKAISDLSPLVYTSEELSHG